MVQNWGRSEYGDHATKKHVKHVTDVHLCAVQEGLLAQQFSHPWQQSYNSSGHPNSNKKHTFQEYSTVNTQTSGMQLWIESWDLETATSVSNQSLKIQIHLCDWSYFHTSGLMDNVSICVLAVSRLRLGAYTAPKHCNIEIALEFIHQLMIEVGKTISTMTGKYKTITQPAKAASLPK